MKPCTFGLIIFLLIIMWEPGLTYGQISNNERNALKAFYEKTGGSNWFHQNNWRKAPGTEPTWHGITCDKGNTTVLEIELHDNNLQGKLPADIEAFSNLTTLDLSKNQLTGKIPSSIEKLKNLRKLDLSNNNFTGSIPTWIGNLKNLEEVILDNNKLNGAIPKELAKLRNLKILKLGSNQITGEIPTEIDKLNNLEDNKSNFKWNGLYTQNIDLKKFLKKKQIGGDWESTQTIAPSDIKVIDFTEDSITICWQPITYTADIGYYKVFYRGEWNPCYDKFVKTTSKTINEVTLNELKKRTKYYFRICTCTDPHRMNTNRIESPFSNELTMTAGGIIISGNIRSIDGEGVPWVQIVASKSGRTTYTHSDGKYELSVIPGWSGTVTPKKEGFKFTPSFWPYDKEVTEDIKGKNYTAESDTVISGKVTYKGQGVGGVTLKFSGENDAVTTGESGNYKKEVPYNWSGSVIPIKYRHQFKPEEKKYTKVTSRYEGQNYEVQLPKIFGQVKNFRGKGIRGIKLKLSNVEKDKFKYLKEYTITDEDGNYEIDILENWIGSVTPESPRKTKYFFFPFWKTEDPEDIKKSMSFNFKAWRHFKFFFSITGNATNTVPYDDDYSIGKSIYPEATVGFSFTRDFYIWSGFGFILTHVNSNISGEISIWLQRSFSLGIGYYILAKLKKLEPHVEMKFTVGIVLLGYKEGTFDDKIKENAWGVNFKYAGIFNINDRLFTEIPIRILFSKHFTDLKIGVGLGYRF